MHKQTSNTSKEISRACITIFVLAKLNLDNKVKLSVFLLSLISVVRSIQIMYVGLSNLTGCNYLSIHVGIAQENGSSVLNVAVTESIWSETIMKMYSLIILLIGIHSNKTLCLQVDNAQEDINMMTDGRTRTKEYRLLLAKGRHQIAYKNHRTKKGRER